MPTEKGGGLEDKPGFLPVFDATGEEDKPAAIRLRKGGLLDLAGKDNELLAEKRVLSDQVRLGASKINGGTEHNRMTGRLSEVEESLFKERDEAFEQLGQPMKEGEHVN